MKTPVSASEAEQLACEEARRGNGQSFSTTLDVGGVIPGLGLGKRVGLGNGRYGQPRVLRWLEHHNCISERRGFYGVSPNPPSARFRFGDGRMGEARHAGDIPACIARSKGKFSAFAADAEIPALLREGPLETPGGELDLSRDMSTLRKQRVGSPPRVNRIGQ